MDLLKLDRPITYKLFIFVVSILLFVDLTVIYFIFTTKLPLFISTLFLFITGLFLWLFIRVILDVLKLIRISEAYLEWHVLWHMADTQIARDKIERLYKEWIKQLPKELIIENSD